MELFFFLFENLGAELAKQMNPSVCTLASAEDGQNLTFQWLAHTRVKSEVTSGEVLGGPPSYMPGLKPKLQGKKSQEIWYHLGVHVSELNILSY